MNTLRAAALSTPIAQNSPNRRRAPLRPRKLQPFLPNTHPATKHPIPSIKSTTRVLAAASMAPTPLGDDAPPSRPFSVLFVCLGNICRSPAAEGVFRHLVKERGLDSEFRIDSAGTINYHEGDQADPRMRASSKKRGIEITSVSRPIKPSDFRDFDLILAMDNQNREDILGAFERWRHRETLPEDAANKVRLMCSFCKRHDETQVPDPYYGGPQGFEKVLDLLEDACGSLLENIVSLKL
ncbi:protein-tyrosine-phosphatase [Salvia divinorum]|uniref:acid phosphatase n=1 Tax=Salvia divinorum TaxID=28513 RepID=A0ABD1HMV0_SALDI